VKDKIKRNKKKTGFSQLIRLDSYLIVANAKVDGQLQKHQVQKFLIQKYRTRTLIGKRQRNKMTKENLIIKLITLVECKIKRRKKSKDGISVKSVFVNRTNIYVTEISYNKCPHAFWI
jgi:hypothetical protein